MLCLFSITSCKEQSVPNQQNQQNSYKYIGSFKGSKMIENNQNLMYTLSLWQKNDQLTGYVEHLLYVTDTNNELFHSAMNGTMTGSNMYLKGKMIENFVLEGNYSNDQLKDIRLKYPSRPSLNVDNITLKKCCQEKAEERKQLKTSEAINLYYQKTIH